MRYLKHSVRPPGEPLTAFDLDERPVKPLRKHFCPLMTFILMFIAFFFLSRSIFPFRVYVFQLVVLAFQRRTITAEVRS